MSGSPLTDLANFLIGDTGDHNRFGPVKCIPVVFYLCLLGAAAYMVHLNWSRDPGQRSFKHGSIMLMRVLARGMWF